ncbi:hypothetical protein [Candidatus Poriferisodalis sp.]|uniref:hypothetical protein n=1 Tax=Candidatus Poriferisodalis sp. TaxID=3101277 RepID=UPI003B029B39
MTELPESADPDTAKVLEILRAARRGSHDPDEELAEMLSELEGSASELDAQELLLGLADDVDSN